MSNGEISAKDLLEKLDSYHNEIVALARETTSSVTTLKAAEARVVASEHKFWKENKPLFTLLATLLALLLFVIGVGTAMKYTPLCVVNVGTDGKSAAITSCKNINLPQAQDTTQAAANKSKSSAN